MTEPISDARNRRRRRLALAITIGLAGVLAASAFIARRAELPEGLSKDDYDRAAQKFRELHRRRPTHLDTLSLAGELAIADNRLETSAACFATIPSDDRAYGPAARLQEAQVLLRLNRAAAAERSFREFLALAARHPSVPGEHVAAARKRLSYLLSVELRLEDRKPILADMHADGQANVFDSKQYFFPHLLIWHSSTGRRRLPEWLEQDPGNPQLRRAEGRYLTAEGRLDEALAWLEELHRGWPADRASAAALLECLFERNDWPEFSAIAASLPDYEPGEPWLLTRMRGELAVHEKNWEAAVRHFSRLLEDDPANPWCHVGLARAYAGLNRREEREKEQHRSLVLSRIRVGLVTVQEDAPAAALELAAQCDDIGFSAAASAFRAHALRIERAMQSQPTRTSETQP